MAETKFNIAVLIDGDNAQSRLIKEIIEEVSKYGKATIRRIYGDWTTPQMNSWKDIINQYSISPIQKFAYTTGKNSTDSSLIIDAMDILHSKSVEGFCIVSSDSDYTGLAKRIREEGIFVMGIGRKTTPVAFSHSCEVFTFSENLTTELDTPKPIPAKPKNKTATAQKGKKTKEIAKAATPLVLENLAKTKTFPAIDLDLIDKAFEISINEDAEAFISKVGASLRKIDPSFDTRTYGFKTLTQLFGKIEKYTVVHNEVNGLNYPLLRLK